MARINFRQGIVRHQTDGANNPVFLQAAGDDVNLLVSPDFTTLNFIHGDKDYLYTESVTVSAAWTAPAGPDYWLYFDLDKVSGVRTFGQTTLEPVTAATAPGSPAAGQMWFDTTKNMWFEHNGASFVEKIRVFAAKYAGGTTFVSMSANTPLFAGTQVGNTSTVNVGSLAFDATGDPIINQDNKFFTTEDVFTAGVPTGASLKVNNILVRAVAEAPLGAFNVVQFSDYDKVNVANPFDAVNAVYGIIDAAVSTGDVANVITEGVIFNAAWDWDGAGAVINDPLYIDATGQLTLIADIPNQVPVAAVIGKQEILFKLGIYGFVSVTDHGSLLGLAGDDHTQYHTDARGDARYSLLLHTHLEADITDLQAYLLDITGEAIGSLSDVTDTTPTVRDVLIHNGAGAYVNRLLVEADISDLGTYEPADATILKDADIGATVEAYNANIQTHIGTVVGNPHSVTATEVGLGNVTNVSEATILTDSVLTGVPVLPSYVKASLPVVGSGGGMIFVSDATGASLVGSMCFSNGTVWIDTTTGAAVV